MARGWGLGGATRLSSIPGSGGCSREGRNYFQGKTDSSAARERKGWQRRLGSRLRCVGVRFMAETRDDRKRWSAMELQDLEARAPVNPAHLIRVIFVPSSVKLYMRPSGSKIKPTTGLVTLSVSIEPPAPTVRIATDPSTPILNPSTR